MSGEEVGAEDVGATVGPDDGAAVGSEDGATVEGIAYVGL